MPDGSNPMAPSIFTLPPSVPPAIASAVLSEMPRPGTGADVPGPSVFLSAHEPLELCCELVGGRHLLEPERVALGAVDDLFELRDHRDVLGVPGDQLVDLAPGAVAGGLERRRVELQPGHRGESVDQGG